MLQHRTLNAAALLGATALLSGCFNSDSSPTAADGTASEDEQAIQVVMDQEMGEYTDIDVRSWDDGSSGASLAPIATERWRRELLTLDKTKEIIFTKPDDGPATADVTVTGDATGLLHLWYADGDSLMHVTKDFEDTAVRRMFFERSRRATPVHRGWQLVAMSGVEIASPGTTRQIRSVNVQLGDRDVSIDNVTDLVPVEQLLRLPGPALIVVTVDTGDATDSVWLHVRRERRIEMNNNGDGTFTARFFTQEHRGPRHFVVDVLSHDTLFDDVAPYDCLAWGIPYFVGPPRPAGGDGHGDGGNGFGSGS